MSDRADRPTKTLRELRQTQSWTQLDVALRLGVSESVVCRWDRGERVPRARTQQRLVDLFGLSVDPIAFGQDEERP